jgi:hypothetical protein
VEGLSAEQLLTGTLQYFTVPEFNSAAKEIRRIMPLQRVRCTAHTKLLQMCNHISPTSAVTKWAIVLLDSFVLGMIRVPLSQN